MKYLLKLARVYYNTSHLLDRLAPMLDLGLRLYIANIFYKSGLTKIQSWDSTLYLFNDVYQVPLLSPEVAAHLATGAELGLSVLLVFGLFGRFAAAGLSILNVVAVISYSELSESGISHHLYWGLLLAVLLISRNVWSMDSWLEKRLQ
jgi:putative oxidoreductase